MFCTKCGSQIPDDSTFCRNCGAPVSAAKHPAPAPAAEKKKAEVPEILTNLLNTVKAFFSKKPESSLAVAQSSKTHEWAILFGLNVLFFAFAYAINARQIIGGSLAGLLSLGGSSAGTSMVSAFLNFGFFLLFGLLISILANGIVLGAYYLTENVLLKGDQDFLEILHTVSFSTVPFTVICVLNMLLGLIWGFLVIPFLLIAALAQIYLLHYAIRKQTNDDRPGFLVFLAVCFIALLLICTIGFLFTRAGLGASVNSALRSLGR